VILLISLVLAWFYPLTRSKHAEVRRQLDTRRAVIVAGTPASMG
jgi:Na+/melibiose symporter-like transporter